MTQDYVPTTEKVKQAYSGLHEKNYYDFDATQREENFDRWLAAHDAQIRAEALELSDEEQQLIIDVFNTDPYLEHLAAGNAIQEYDERQAYLIQLFNSTLLGLFPMIVEHRKEQK